MRGTTRLTVIKSKVLKVDISAWIELPGRLDERVDKFVIPLAPDALGPESKVQIVLKKIFIICTAVQDHRQGPVRVDASTQCGEDELGYGDEDTTAALVADTQDFLAVLGEIST